MAGDKGQELEAAAHLNSAAIHLLRALSRLDQETGVSPGRLSALSVLVFGGSCTLGALAAIEGVTPPTMSRIVDGLCALGLADRVPRPRSGRVVDISATPQGEKLMRAAARRRQEVIAVALDALPERERRAVLAAAPSLPSLAASVKDGVRARAATRRQGHGTP